MCRRIGAAVLTDYLVSVIDVICYSAVNGFGNSPAERVVGVFYACMAWINRCLEPVFGIVCVRCGAIRCEVAVAVVAVSNAIDGIVLVKCVGGVIGYG